MYRVLVQVETDEDLMLSYCLGFVFLAAVFFEVLNSRFWTLLRCGLVRCFKKDQHKDKTLVPVFRAMQTEVFYQLSEHTPALPLSN